MYIFINNKYYTPQNNLRPTLLFSSDNQTFIIDYHFINVIIFGSVFCKLLSQSDKKHQPHFYWLLPCSIWSFD